MSQPHGSMWVDPEGVSNLGDHYEDHRSQYELYETMVGGLRSRYGTSWGDDDMGKQFSGKFLEGLDALENIVGGVKGTLGYTAEGLRQSGKAYRAADDDAIEASSTMDRVLEESLRANPLTNPDIVAKPVNTDLPPEPPSKRQQWQPTLVDHGYNVMLGDGPTLSERRARIQAHLDGKNPGPLVRAATLGDEQPQQSARRASTQQGTAADSAQHDPLQTGLRRAGHAPGMVARVAASGDEQPQQSARTAPTMRRMAADSAQLDPLEPAYAPTAVMPGETLQPTPHYVASTALSSDVSAATLYERQSMQQSMAPTYSPSNEVPGIAPGEPLQPAPVPLEDLRPALAPLAAAPIESPQPTMHRVASTTLSSDVSAATLYERQSIQQATAPTYSPTHEVQGVAPLTQRLEAGPSTTQPTLVNGQSVPPGFELLSLPVAADGTSQIDLNSYTSVMPVASATITGSTGEPVPDGNYVLASRTAGLPSSSPYLVTLAPDGSITGVPQS